MAACHTWHVTLISVIVYFIKEQTIVLSWQAMRKIYNLQILRAILTEKIRSAEGNFGYMRLQLWKQWKKNAPLSLYLNCGAILLLFLFSVLIVACGSTPTNANLGQTDVTVTINLGQNDSSPTPPLPEYTCSAWVTNTTPGIGLAIFPVSVANKSADLYKIILVTVAFQGPQGVPPCDVTVDRAAFFTLVKSLPAASATAGASPTAISTATATATNSPTPTPTPKPCPTVNPKRTPTPCP